MPQDEFEERLDRINQIAAAVGKFDNPVLQEAAYHYLVGDGSETRSQVHTPKPAPRPPTPRGADDVHDLDATSSPPSPAKKGSAKASSGKKQSFDVDKSLNFYKASGSSKLPLKEFVDVHKPKSNVQKVTIAVYWLKHEALVEHVTIGQIYTAFKTMEWPIPTDLANTLAQAGSKNYLDSKNRDDISLTTHGENLVEHELVKAATS